MQYLHLGERLGARHARIGQRKSLARALSRIRQPEHRDTIAFDGLERKKMRGLDPMRHAEKDAAMVQRLALLREACPGGVAERQIERLGRAFLLPSGDMGGKGALGERLAHRFLDGAPQRRPVEALRVRIFLDRLALHEETAAAMHRIERSRRRDDRGKLGLDVEELAQEGLQMRPERDQERALVALGNRPGLRTGREQRRTQLRSLRLEHREEAPVEPDEPVTLREVGKAEAEAEGCCVHARHDVGEAAGGCHSGAPVASKARGRPPGLIAA